jgi:hypothetical protein
MRLDVGERSPNAIVNASAEAKMLIVCTVRVKLFWVGKACRVAPLGPVPSPRASLSRYAL